jgi:hypothetical protein
VLGAVALFSVLRRCFKRFPMISTGV